MMKCVNATETITVEFYGVARLRAGRAEVAVTAATIEEALRAVERDCPGLKGLMTSDCRLSSQYLLSMDGEEFVTDLRHKVHAGSRVLLLSADAGG
jgi:molybdopterin converting factor small subunit